MFRKKMRDMREDCAIPHIEIQNQEAHIDLDVPRRRKRVELVHPICARELKHGGTRGCNGVKNKN